jgi:hypothetical protein
MNKRPTKKSDIELVAKKSPQTNLTSTNSDIDNYETFKAAEQVCEIVNESIYVVVQENPGSCIPKVNHEYDTARCQAFTGIVIMPHFHTLDTLCTPWGEKRIIVTKDLSEKEKKLAARIIELIGSRLTLAAEPFGDLNGKPFSVVAVNGKNLPPLIMRDYYKNRLDATMVKKYLKKHQERYKKEITNEVVPFINVRSVAEIVTAYVYNPANG